MSESWIELDAKKINRPTEIEFKGVQISIQASPFHTPDKAMIFISRKGEAIIKFMYDGGESSSWRSKTEDLGEGVSVRLDPRNGRIYEFILPTALVSASRPMRLELQMRKASEHLSESVPVSRNISRGNYQAAINAMMTYSSQLAGALS